MKMTIIKRGKWKKNAELRRAIYSSAKKRCIPIIVDKISLEREMFDVMPRLSSELEDKLTSEELDTVVKPWMEKYKAEIKANEEDITVKRAITILKRLTAGLKRSSISNERANNIYTLLEEVKKALKETGHAAPKKQPTVKRNSSDDPPVK